MATMMPVAKLARACSCDTATINGIENETIPCDEQYLTRIARELNVSLAQLTQDLHKENTTQSAPTQESQLPTEQQVNGLEQTTGSHTDLGTESSFDPSEPRREATTKEVSAALNTLTTHLAGALAQCAAATAADPDDYKLRLDLAQVLQVVDRAENLRKDLATVENICFRLKNHHQPADRI
ncbi:helix-turn-helix domain-containing protein [Duganella vulcania]|uniref:HTH cro/C1-type domain-containing protein n=1 Tax=Duganella vulcania TaxID=2692166 RepID=A0A845GH69_9BURK|nr:helix-turn-helix transcriptional regulator [Duganella vulcania]MYM92772.1 hypothetical protein [Duganella vulcania]